MASFPRVCLPLALLYIGCADDAASPQDTDDTSSTSSTTGPDPVPTSDTGESSSQDTEETGGSSTGDPGDESSSTGDPASDASGRFVVRVTEDDRERLILLEYANGAVSEPLDLLVADQLMWTNYVDGRLLVTCWLSEDTAPCGVIDLAEDPPSPAQSLVSGDVPEGMTLSQPHWVPATQTVWFEASSRSGGDGRLFSASVEDGVVAPARRIVEPPPGLRLLEYEVGPDGAQVGYVLRDEGGVTTGYVRPADPDGDAVQITTPLDAGQFHSAPRLLPEQQAAVFEVNESGPVPNGLSWWFVDLSEGTPASPVRIDGTLDAASRLQASRMAPDRRALAFARFTTEAGPVELVLVPLSNGPQPPVVVSGATAHEFIAPFEWSPDSRWLGYVAADASDAGSLHLVNTAGPSPSGPFHVSEGLVPGGRVQGWVVDSNSQWLYLAAQIESEDSRLFRVDISSDVPGPLELLPTPAGWVDEDFIFSHDETLLLHGLTTTSRQAGPVRQLAMADLSQGPAGTSVVLNGPVTPGMGVGYGPRFSANDSVVAYRETAENASINTLRLVEVANPGRALELDIPATLILSAPDLR